MTVYQPGIPTGFIDLDVDYQNIQNNFTQLDTTYKIDHIPLTQAPFNGFHTVVHLTSFSSQATNPPNNQPVSSPPTVGGVGEIFSAQIDDGLNPDEALYFKTGGGRLMQFTRNFTPIPLTNNYAPASGGPNVGTDFNAGATFISGGIIFQWGSFEPGTFDFPNPITGTVKLPQKFTNANSKITISPICKNGGTSGRATFSIQDGTVTATEFKWNLDANTNRYTGFTWIAIGI